MKIHPPCSLVLNIITYNIRNGRSFGILQSILETHLGDYDLMILTKTKIPYAVYCKNCLGYYIVM